MELALISEQNLRDFKEAADSRGLRFMLQEGTLLGAYRDKNFCKDDENDIDLGIMDEEFGKVDEVIKILENKGFVNKKRVDFKGIFHGGCWERNGCHIDLMRMIKDEGIVYNIGAMGAIRYDYPAEIFNGYSKIIFRGMEFDAPADIEGFLKTRYGDWKTPIGIHAYSYDNPIFSPNVRRNVVEEEVNIGGIKFLIRPNSWDDTILKSEIMANVYKIGSPKVVVDIGAHIGGTAMLCAYYGAKVYAYEPSRRNFNRLYRNVRLNNLNVEMFRLAVVGDGAKNKKYLFWHKYNFGCFSFNRNNVLGMIDDGEEVDTISIKDVFKNIEHCDLLKCDCEGAEEEFYQEIPVEKIDQISIEIHKSDSKIKEFLSKFYKIEEIFNGDDRLLICKK